LSVIRLFGRHGTPAMRVDSRDEQYISDDVRFYHAGRGLVFVEKADASEAARVISTTEASVLSDLARFRTTDDHLSRLAQRRRKTVASRFLEDTIRDLLSSGLLRSRAETLSAIRRRRTDAAGSISTVVWPTLDRTDSLVKSVRSYFAHTRGSGRDLRYLVVSNSLDPGTCDHCRQRIREEAESREIPVYFCGLEEKRRFITELEAEARGDGLSRELMEFALLGKESDGSRYGTARNTTLLATAGEMILTTDDDTLCRFAEPPVDAGGLELTSISDPVEMRFFPGREELAASSRPVEDTDILEAHETLLGRSVGDCLVTLGSDESLVTDGMSPHFARFLVEKTAAVALTQAGVRGDTAMNSPATVTKIEGSALELVTRTEAAYTSAKTSREVLRGVKRRTISEGASFMTVNAAMDNRILLPPFFTIGRNEEGIFALIMRTCFENRLIGSIPLCIQHEPPDPRRLIPETVSECSPKVGEVLILLLESYHRLTDPSETPEQRIRALGLHVSEIASPPTPQFEGYVRYRWMVHMSAYINFLDEQLDRYAALPAYWIRDVVALKESVRSFLASGRIAFPEEAHRELSTTAVSERVRAVIGRFGELLQWWPLIVRYSRRLNAEGRGLAVRV